MPHLSGRKILFLTQKENGSMAGITTLQLDPFITNWSYYAVVLQTALRVLRLLPIYLFVCLSVC